MLEILLTISLFTSPSLPTPIEVTDNQTSFSLNTTDKTLVNNIEIDPSNFELISGENKITVISDQNKVLTHLLVITQKTLCKQLEAKIEKIDIENNKIKLYIPENCDKSKFKLITENQTEIENLIINEPLDDAFGTLALNYNNQVVDFKCWAKNTLSDMQIKHIERLNKTPEDCDITQTEVKEESNNIKQSFINLNYKDLIILNAMPNADKEFISIQNSTLEPIDLKNVYITDKTAKKMYLTGIIQPEEIKQIKNLTFALNNSDEEIYIKNTDNNEIIDFREYKKSTQDQLIDFSLVENTKEQELSNENQNTREIETSNETVQILESNIELEQSNILAENPTNNSENLNQITYNPSETSNQNQDASNSLESTENAQHITITEVLPNPHGDERENQFIEIFNPNPFSLDTTKYKVMINSKEIELPTNLEPKQYFSTNKLQLSNTKASIKLTYKDQIIQELNYNKTTEGLSFIDINNQWLQTSLITRDKANGKINNYNQSIQVLDNQILIEDTQIKQGPLNLQDGTYEKAEFMTLENSNGEEIIKIINLEQSDVQNIEEINTPLNQTKKDITSMGFLSMASLAIIYNFIK